MSSKRHKRPIPLASRGSETSVEERPERCKMLPLEGVRTTCDDALKDAEVHGKQVKESFGERSNLLRIGLKDQVLVHFSRSDTSEGSASVKGIDGGNTFPLYWCGFLFSAFLSGSFGGEESLPIFAPRLAVRSCGMAL